MSTPKFIVNYDPRQKDLEFGRMAETIFFYGSVDWIRSRLSIAPNFINTFLTGVNNNTELPMLGRDQGQIYRSKSIGVGADIFVEESWID